MDLGTIIALFILAVLVFLIVASVGRRTRRRPGSRSGGADGYVEVMNEGSGQHQHHHHHHSSENWGGHHSGHDFGSGSHHSGGHDFGGGFGGGHHG